MKRPVLIATALRLAGSAASAAQWQVEVTNVTPGQTSKPILVATHFGDSVVPGVGAPATDALAMLAESGAGPEEILSPVHYSWNNPVAVVTLRRMHDVH